MNPKAKNMKGMRSFWGKLDDVIINTSKGNSTNLNTTLRNISGYFACHKSLISLPKVTVLEMHGEEKR